MGFIVVWHLAPSPHSKKALVSVQSLHVLRVRVWVISGHSGFLLLSKNFFRASFSAMNWRLFHSSGWVAPASRGPAGAGLEDGWSVNLYSTEETSSSFHQTINMERPGTTTAAARLLSAPLQGFLHTPGLSSPGTVGLPHTRLKVSLCLLNTNGWMNPTLYSHCTKCNGWLKRFWSDDHSTDVVLKPRNSLNWAPKGFCCFLVSFCAKRNDFLASCSFAFPSQVRRFILLIGLHWRCPCLLPQQRERLRTSLTISALITDSRRLFLLAAHSDIKVGKFAVLVKSLDDQEKLDSLYSAAFKRVVNKTHVSKSEMISINLVLVL